MIVEGLVFAGAMVLTAGVGLPLALATAQAHRWPRPAPRDQSSGGRTPPQRAQFTPLDLGQDPVKWPSERKWHMESTLPTPAWPSTEWNDEHFGQHGKKAGAEVQDRGFHAMAGRRGPDGALLAEGAPTPAPPTETPKARSRGPKPTAASEKGRQLKAARSGAPQAPRNARDTAPRPAAGPPDEAEIEHLISTVGLAGTVQAIMTRTGWEFREAAQYLAQRRRG